MSSWSFSAEEAGAGSVVRAQLGPWVPWELQGFDHLRQGDAGWELL